jgi:protein ImuB
MADTIGAAWAIARFGNKDIAASGETINALLPLPPAALRLEMEVIDRFQKLGFRQIKDFVTIPRPTLRRRFGHIFITRLNQVLGIEEDVIHLVQPVQAYEEKLPCLEPISKRAGIEIALMKLLEKLCCRLEKEQKGLRKAIFIGYRLDGELQKVEIGTNRPSRNAAHIFNLFELQLERIEPGLGIEVFALQAPIVEPLSVQQEQLWAGANDLNNSELSELLDKMCGKLGGNRAYRYLPREHYWPERSIIRTESLFEKPQTNWNINRPRPLLLQYPKPIEVTAPIPDYPPMLFRYQGKLHKIVRADGPERIEQEWWLREGEHRDYYYVEDEEGQRYWLFRLGHYDTDKKQWFIHGFFA